jgi:hypothetical protein
MHLSLSLSVCQRGIGKVGKAEMAPPIIIERL